MVVIKSKKPLTNCILIFNGHLSYFLKKIKDIVNVIKNIKKYLPQTTCIKWISEERYFAIPSINGSNIHPIIFKRYAFIIYWNAVGSHILQTKSPTPFLGL